MVRGLAVSRLSERPGDQRVVVTGLPSAGENGIQLAHTRLGGAIARVDLEGGAE